MGRRAIMYSQSLEEKVILEYFKDASTGTFIDIGANEGQTFSNTRALALRGFFGVLVEPSPSAFKKLKTLYDGHKGIYLYQVAINDHNGKAILQESGPLCSSSDIGLVSTFHNEEMDRFKRTVSYTPVEVKTFRWKTFLNRLTIKEFSFVSIDAEGSDLTILQQMDLGALKTQCVCIEHNSKPELKKQYLEVTSKFGLDKIIYESGENIIIVRS